MKLYCHFKKDILPDYVSLAVASLLFLFRSSQKILAFVAQSLLWGQSFNYACQMGGSVRSERSIIMGIRFGANSSASPGARGIVATSLVASRLSM